MSRPPRVVAEPARRRHRVGDRRQLARGVERERRAPAVRRHDRGRRARRVALDQRLAAVAVLGAHEPARRVIAELAQQSPRSARRPCAGGGPRRRTATPRRRRRTGSPCRRGDGLGSAGSIRRTRVGVAVVEQGHAGAVDHELVRCRQPAAVDRALELGGRGRAGHLRAEAHRAHDDAVGTDADDPAPAGSRCRSCRPRRSRNTLPSRPSASECGPPIVRRAAVDVELVARRSARTSPRTGAGCRRSPSSMMIPASVSAISSVPSGIASSERMSRERVADRRARRRDRTAGPGSRRRPRSR